MGLLLSILLFLIACATTVMPFILAIQDFGSPSQDVLSKISDFIDKKSAIKLYLYGDSYSVLKRFKKLNRKMSKNKEFENPIVRELEMKWILRILFSAPFKKKKIANSSGFNVDSYRSYIESINKMYLASFKDDKVLTLEMFDKYFVVLYFDDLYSNTKKISCDKKKSEFIDYAYKLLESTYNEDDMIYPTCLNQIHIAKELINKDTDIV